MISQQKYSKENFKKLVRAIGDKKKRKEIDKLEIDSSKNQNDIAFLKDQYSKRRKEDTVKLL